MTDTNTAPKKAKLAIPAADFDTDLTSGSVQSLIKAAGATSSKANEGGVVRFAPAAIRRIDGFNVRIRTPDYIAHIADIKASLVSEGYYADKPMAGFAAKEGDEQVLLLTDGYSRLEAIDELIAEGHADFANDAFTIPVIIKPQTQTLEDLTVALVLGNEGRTLTVFEKALVVKRLIGMGLTNAQVEQRLKMSDRYVLDMIVLAGAPAKVRDLVLKNKISATEAISQIKKHGAGAADKIAAGVKKAEAKGKKKATAKDVESADGEGGEGGSDKKRSGGLISETSSIRNGKIKETLVYAFKQGEIVPKDMILPVARFHDMEFWAWVDEKTKEDAVIEESIKITVVIETDQPVDGENEKAADETFEAITDESGAGDDEGDDGDTAEDEPEGGQDAEDGAADTETAEDAEDGSTDAAEAPAEDAEEL